MVLRMVRQQEDAEDICQEVFIRVYKSISKYRGKSKLSTWVGAIAYNTCLDHVRKKGKELVVHTDQIVEFSATQPSPHTPSEVLQRNEVKAIVHGLIGASFSSPESTLGGCVFWDRCFRCHFAYF